MTYQEMCDHLVNEVISHRGRESLEIKNRFKIDLENYSWIEIFLKDLKKRDEIEKLNQEIVQVKHHTLIGKDKIRKDFENWQKETRQEFKDLIKKGLLEIQGRKGDIEGIAERADLRSLQICSLSQNEVEDIFSSILNGVSQAEIDKEVSALEAKIEKLKEGLQKSLSLKERWIHDESGSPLPYPQGCRWTIFVEAWERVAARFSGACTIEGVALSTDSEKKAWKLLEMDEVHKSSPLREPFEN